MQKRRSQARLMPNRTPIGIEYDLCMESTVTENAWTISSKSYLDELMNLTASFGLVFGRIYLQQVQYLFQK